jgi:hypothetical protein
MFAFWAGKEIRILKDAPGGMVRPPGAVVPGWLESESCADLADASAHSTIVDDLTKR